MPVRDNSWLHTRRCDHMTGSASPRRSCANQKIIRNHPRPMMKQIVKHVKQKGKHLHAAGSIENAKKNSLPNMPWQARRAKIFRQTLSIKKLFYDKIF